MVRRCHRWRPPAAHLRFVTAGVLALVTVLASTGRGLAQAPEDRAAAPDSADVDTLPAEVIEALAELDAAGQPLAERELREGLAGRADHGQAGRTQAARVLDLRWRVGALAGGTRHDGRVELKGRQFAGRGVLRLRPGRAAELAGGVHLRAGPARAWAGQLTMRHGFGLLAGDPARRPSLGADRTLGGVSGGLSIRTSSSGVGLSPDIGAAMVAGQWEFSGKLGTGPSADLNLRMARDGANGGWALLAHRDSSSQALSWCGRQTRSRLEVAWEVAARRAPGWPGAAAATAGWAAVTGMAWRPSTTFRIEVLSGAASLPWVETVSVLPTAAHSGWALRVAWRDRGHGVLQAMAQGARQWPRGPAPRRRGLQAAELAWERSAGAGFFLSLRARHTAGEEITWSERSPWEPGTRAADGSRALVTADLEWRDGNSRLRGRWRSFTVSGGNAGNRQALGLGGYHDFTENMNMWMELTAAWGDPVDLVTALTPLPGLVVARHWGHWRSEAAWGFTLDRAPLALRAGLARRLPEPAPWPDAGDVRPALEGWLEVVGSW